MRAVIGAVKISGRWVDQQVLERLSRRSQGPEAPARRELVAEFCRAVGWRDIHGRFCVSSAHVALRRLEKRGLVQLPPMAARNRGPVGRGLLDDGGALPQLPKLPSGGGKIAGLRLRLIEGEDDPAHRVWNRLIVREHPQGRRPLVGAQVRYLIECPAGIVGAFGFGPPAYHLECRDQWVGWSLPARQQNRGKVIGLSRFLIRSGLRVPNLASQCYSLVLGQVGQHWQEKYGLRPVLVETYVDRVRYHGRSLAAANWRRLGQSKGRGRDDRQRQCAQSPKDVWVYELHPKARAQLQACAPPVVAPRSVFAAALKEDWTQEEMAGVSLGDERLNQRAQRMLRQRWARPTQSFCRSFDNLAESKGAYELLENPRIEINLTSLLAAHQQQTARRMAAEAMVLLAQDTTGLGYSTLHQTTGLGPLGVTLADCFCIACKPFAWTASHWATPGPSSGREPSKATRPGATNNPLMRKRADVGSGPCNRPMCWQVRCPKHSCWFVPTAKRIFMNSTTRSRRHQPTCTFWSEGNMIAV